MRSRNELTCSALSCVLLAHAGVVHAGLVQDALSLPKCAMAQSYQPTDPLAHLHTAWRVL
jgi:hypothetical protein